MARFAVEGSALAFCFCRSYRRHLRFLESDGPTEVLKSDLPALWVLSLPSLQGWPLPLSEISNLKFEIAFMVFFSLARSLARSITHLAALVVSSSSILRIDPVYRDEFFTFAFRSAGILPALFAEVSTCPNT
jgi:hypothetical protein